MQRLPPLTVEDGPCRLPLAEATAQALVGALIDRTSRTAVEQLADALSLDPALALWAACHHARSVATGQPPPTISQLATWLAGRLSALIRDHGFSPDAERSPTAAGIDRDRLAQIAARDIEAAERAVAGADYQSDPRYLIGLVRGAPDWLAAAACRADAAAMLPGWLGKMFLAPEAVVIDSPVGGGAPPALLIGESSPADPSTSPASAAIGEGGARPRAAAARWLAPAGFARENFAALAQKLARLTDLEERFQDRLMEEKLAALAEFAAGAGHEINNPLAVISGRAQLFLRAETDPQRRHDLAVINTQARRIHEMIADLMLFARPPQPRPMACDVVKLLRDVVAELAPVAAERSAELVLVGAQQTPAIEADATQLAVAVRAVCENALAAVNDGGRIEVGLALRRPGVADDGQVAARRLQTVPCMAITIRDNGPGMSALVRRHAFDPFFSGHGAGRGIGLGLSKCWRIVTNHAGRVEIDSTAGQGTCVTILLPCEAPAASTSRGDTLAKPAGGNPWESSR